MAFVYPYRATSTAGSEQISSPRPYAQPLIRGAWRRFWWHTKAYGTVSGVVLIAIASLLFLQLHWFQRQFVQGFFTDRNRDTDPVL